MSDPINADIVARFLRPFTRECAWTETGSHNKQNTCPHLHRTLVSRRDAARCSSQKPSGYFSTLNSGFSDTRAFPVAPQFGHRISSSDRLQGMLRISANAFLDQAAIALGDLELM